MYKGFSAGMTRMTIYQGLKMAIYEPMRDALTPAGSAATFVQRALTGGAAGAIGAVIANPIDVVKIRMQADRTGTRYRSLGGALAQILREEGVKGYYKGSVPTIYRAFVVNAAELATYDTVKAFFLHRNWLGDTLANHFVSSFIAGFVATCAACPIDVSKTRLMNQPFDERGHGKLYRGMVDCLIKTARAEGPLGLYKGFLPMWLRLGPWNMIFFISFEQMRKLQGRLSPDH